MSTAFSAIVKSELEIHVVPDDDVIDHEMDDRCVCGPKEVLVVENDHYEGSIMMHASLDGREVSDEE